MRRLWLQAGAVIGVIALMVATFAVLSPAVTAHQPLGEKPPGDQPYTSNPLDLTIPGSPLSVIVRPSGSYAVYRNNIQQFYGQYAEGVYLWVNGQVWGPERVPAGRVVNEYTQVSSILSGTGTQGDPWKVTNVLGVGNTGLQLTQEVRYVNGQEFIRNDWTLCNTGTTPFSNIHLFNAADLWTDNNDYGYGYYDAATGAIGGYNQAQTLFQIFIPITPANQYEEDFYGTIWGDIGDTSGVGPGFHDTYRPNDYIDNGAGLEWIFGLTAGACETVSDYLSFANIPVLPTATDVPSNTPISTATTTPTATAVPPSATETPACTSPTPLVVVTPAFTPGPGCSATPPHGALDATIINQVGTTEAIFTNHSQTCSYPIGLATYRRFDNNIDHQLLYDYSGAVLPPNSTLVLTVNNPLCAFQADAFYGDLLQSLAGGVRYNERLLDDINGNGNDYCVPGCPTPVCPAGTPIPIVTPAFTPGPGCSTQPGYNVLDATITDSATTTVAVIINHSTTCSYPIGLASYRRFDSTVANQQLYDYELAVIGPGATMTLTVDLPPCAYQTDAFYGPIIPSFAGGARYGSRLLDDTVSSNRPYCTCSTPTPGPVITDTPAPPTRLVTNTPAPPTQLATNTPAPPTRLVTNTPIPPPTRLSTPTPITNCVVNFSDVSADNPFYAYVRCLVCHGVVSGYTDGTFRPGSPVTRGQVAKIIANSANLDLFIPTGQQTFEDVPANSTFWLWIERAAKAGLVNGYPCGGAGESCVAPTNRPYFRPALNVTRGQLAKIAANAAGFNNAVSSQTFADVATDSPFYTVIERMAARGIISGYPCGGVGEDCNAAHQPYYRPGNAMTRGQMAKIAGVTFFPSCALAP